MEATYAFDAVDAGVLRALDPQVAPGQSLRMSPYWPPLLDRYKRHGLLRPAL